MILNKKFPKHLFVTDLVNVSFVLECRRRRLVHVVGWLRRLSAGDVLVRCSLLAQLRALLRALHVRGYVL